MDADPMRSTDPALEPRDRWFDGAGIRIHGLDWGGPDGGQVVLLLHGVGNNAWIWDDVAPRLRRSLPGYRIVAIDQREGGDTEHPDEGYDRSDFAADVRAVVAALGGGPVVLVGHSRGGWLGAWIAATWPELVDVLVLVDPARLEFASVGDADRFYAWVEGGLGPFASEAEAVGWARAQDPEADWTPVRTRSFLFGLRVDEDGRLVGKLPRAAVAKLRAARTDGSDVVAAVSTLRMPTLLLVADRQPPERRAHKMRYGDLIPDVELVPIDGSHFIHTDAPAEVAARIADFVRRRSGGYGASAT
jgi:pimeloyl-ACP methyl ester carboxylesterase